MQLPWRPTSSSAWVHPTLERVLCRGQVLEGPSTVQDLKSPDERRGSRRGARARRGRIRGQQNVDIRLIVEGARRPRRSCGLSARIGREALPTRSAMPGHARELSRI